MSWVIQARNNEYPYWRDAHSPTKAAWDIEWHTIPETAYVNRDIDTFSRPFELWSTMHASTMEETLEVMLFLRSKWVEKHGETLASFRLYNVVTGEVVPAEIFLEEHRA